MFKGFKLFFVTTLFLVLIYPSNAAYLDKEYYDNLKLLYIDGAWEWAGTGSVPYHVIGVPDGKIIRMNDPNSDGKAAIVYVAKIPFKTAIVNLAEIHQSSPTGTLISTGATPSDEAVYVSKDGKNWIKLTWDVTDRELIINDANVGDVTNDGIDDYADIYQIVFKLDEPYSYLKIQDEVGGEKSIEVESAGAIPVYLGDPNSRYVLEINGVPLDGENAKIYLKPGETVTFKVYERDSGLFGFLKNYVGGVDIYIDDRLIGRIPEKGKLLFWDNPFSQPSFTYSFPQNGTYTTYGIKDGIYTTGGIIYVGQTESSTDVVLHVTNREPVEEGIYEIEFGDTLQFRVYAKKAGGWFGLLGFFGVYDYVPVANAKIYDTVNGIQLLGTTDENGYFSYTFAGSSTDLYRMYLIHAEYENKPSNVIEVRVFDQLNNSIPIQEINVTGDKAYLEVFVGTNPKGGTIYMPIPNASVFFYEWDDISQDYQLIGHLKTASNGTLVTAVPANKQLKIVADAEGYKESEPTLITLIPDEKKSLQIILTPDGAETPFTEYYLNARPVNESLGRDLTIPAGEKIEFWISKDTNSWYPEVGGMLHILNERGMEIFTNEIPAPNPLLPGLLGGGKLEFQFDTPGKYTAYAEVDGERTKNTLTITVLEQSDYNQYKNDYFVVADKRTANVGETIEVWVTKGELSLDKGKSVNATIEIYKAHANGTLTRWAKAATIEKGFFTKEYVAKFHLIEPGTFVIQGDVGGVKTRNTWKLVVREGSVTDPSALRLGWKLKGSPGDNNMHNAFIGSGAALGTILGAIFGGGVGAIPGGILGAGAGYGLGWAATVIDDWFKDWQYEDAVLPVGSKVEFAIVQNGEKKTGELYINGERVGVFNNGSYEWTFSNPGEYEIRAYYATNSVNASAQNTTLVEVTNSPIYFTVGTAGQGIFSMLPPLTGIPVLDVFIYAVLAMMLLAVLLSILRIVL